jgi:hypothetical protein
MHCACELQHEVRVVVALAQRNCPPPQTHPPWLHEAPSPSAPPHAHPQPPQCAGSVIRSRHMPPHQLWFAGQHWAGVIG